MARGAGHFNGPALRQARQAAGLSAERLAKMVGTTKAMVLAYEAGKTIPEAGRAAALADALKISRAALLPASTVREEPDGDRESQTDYEINNSPAIRLSQQFGISKEQMEALLSVDGRVVPRMHDRSLRDLRRIAGLSGVETAARAGISVSTYRAIENEGRLPSRGNGRFPALLAKVLHIPVKRIEDALILHPNTVLRRIEVADVFRQLLDEVEENPDLTVSPESPAVTITADLLAQPPAILSRAINYEIYDHRRALRRQADALSRAKYPLSHEQIREGAAASLLSRLRRRLRHAPERAAARLWWSLSQALTIRQWRTFASLINVQVHMAQRVTFSDTMIDPDVGSALTYSSFRGLPILEASADPYHRPVTYRFTPISASFYAQEREFYAYLYPRIYAPNLRYSEREKFPARLRVM
ncbi:helix-turn-helix domain-containing protein [Streptomyces koyangensis]|uniref:helix-turn-helix domain-containing protein n=1 Tax=Streptomyces koyangensis TaxID=188770 RepID=UPI003C2E70D5